MELKEEVQVASSVVDICRTLSNNRDNIKSFYYGFGDHGCMQLQTNPDRSITFTYRHMEISYTLFCVENRDYGNMRANDIWSFNCCSTDPEFNTLYTLLCPSGYNEEYSEEDEEYIDSLLYDKRIMTEDEFFQCSLLTSKLPNTYEDVLLILDTLHNTDCTGFDEDVSISVYMTEFFTMELIDKIRTVLTNETGLDFLGGN